MYTEVKSYQFIIAMLKEKNIRNCVLSAGSRNLPFVHSVEEDDFFNCYSVVDERSAGYFALGLAQQLNEPVVISCTSSTATCNYWPPVAEAFYQNVPLIVLTSDRDPEMLGQWEDQMIDQVGMYDRHVRKSINLPIINNRNDEIYCQRLLNEAFLELNHNGFTGPIHINIPTNTYNRTFNVKELPKINVIERLSYNDSKEKWKEKQQRLKKANRILVTCGQKNYVSDELKSQINMFFKKYNSTIIVDYMSNLDFEEGINTTILMDSNYVSSDKMKELMPEIVISFGGQIFSGIKVQLKNNNGKFEHWLIQENGQVVDLYKSLKNIFECTPEYFFKFMNEEMEKNTANNKVYYNEFKEYEKSIVYPEFEYCSIYAIKNVVERIPENSILHLSINDSIRITNYFKMKKNIRTYANIGTHGIDGCMSSFIGQACADIEKNSYLIIGDLAFFYDMNSLRINRMPKNVHILLINNHGGSEFYYNKIWQNSSSDMHTAARHNIKAEGWVKENGFEYLAAHDKKSFDDCLSKFMNNNTNKPILLEVFTEMSSDAKQIEKFYELSRPKNLKNEFFRVGKEIVKKKIGQEKVKKIINAIKS